MISILVVVVVAVKNNTYAESNESYLQKWQQDNDRDHQMLVWLHCELERDNVHVAFLLCDVCKRYKDSIVSLRNFWITGTTNQKILVIMEREIHKVAKGDLKSVSAKAKGESLFANSIIGQMLMTLDATTQARMRRKFDVCYMMAKENILFLKYLSFWELEDHHDIDMGPAYRTPDSAKSFISFIATCQRNDFLGKLKYYHFYSILMDGTTDLGNKEEEIVAMVYCYKNEVAQEMTSCTRYWSVHSPETAGMSWSFP